MMYNLICYTWLAIILLGAWHERRTKPKKGLPNIGKRRARSAKRRAEYDRQVSQRTVVKPKQQSLWADYQ
jgi:hypothetical protein